jgi:hypothetical protein
VKLDYASICASDGSAPNIVFETEPSKFQRSYYSDTEYRLYRTQIVSNNGSREEFKSALLSIARASKRLASASVYSHGLVVECRNLEVVRLLPSVAAGEDFVDNSAGIKIPCLGSNKLVPSLTSPTPYLNGAPEFFIAEKSHVFTTTDPTPQTRADSSNEKLRALVAKHDASGEYMRWLDSLIEDDRRSDAPITPATTKAMTGWPVSRRKNEKRTDNLQSFSDASNGDLPTVLFLEIGTEDAAPSDWQLVRQTLKERLQKISQGTLSPTPEEENPSLSLKSDNSSGVEALWTLQIRQFVSNHQKTHETTSQKMLLVMCVQPGEKNAAQYQILKKACDVEVGIPSISVKRSTLQEKAKSKNSVDTAAMVVGSIRRKLRLRNPPMLADSQAHKTCRHLIVSIHVETFSTPGPQVLDDGSLRNSKSKMFLVALVSRARDSSVDYHTQVKLYSESDFEELGVTDLVRQFFDAIETSPRELTILRTGYLVDGSAAPSGSAGPDSPATPDSSTTTKVGRLINERNDIAKAYAQLPNHGAFKYAILSEDKLLKVSAGGKDCSPDGNNRESLLIAAFDVREDKSQSSFWVFHNKKAAVDATGVKVTFLPEAVSSQTPDRNQHKHHAKLDLSNLSDRSVHTPTPRSRVVSGLVRTSPSPSQSPNSPSPEPQALDLSKTRLTPQSLDNKPHDSSNNPVASSDEVDFLNQIWMDEHLELYNTEWSIPTYLAHLALKRARMHLVTNDWEYEKHGQTAPVYLPEVHSNVCDTLYYV